MSVVLHNQEHHTLHSYQRSRKNKEIYMCVYPDCRHYQNRDKLEGKRAECPKCKNSFILSWAQLKNKTPVCDFCTKSPKAIKLHEAFNLVQTVIQQQELDADNPANILLEAKPATGDQVKLEISVPDETVANEIMRKIKNLLE